MGGLETMADALRRLEADGYSIDFRALDGRLTGDDITALPEEFHVDGVVRFEGESDPSDEAAIFALTHVASAHKGTYLVAYGPEMDVADAEMARRLG